MTNQILPSKALLADFDKITSFALAKLVTGLNRLREVKSRGQRLKGSEPTLPLRNPTGLVAFRISAKLVKIRLSQNPQCMYPGCSAEPIRSHTISKSSIRQLNTDTIQLKTIKESFLK